MPLSSAANSKPILIFKGTILEKYSHRGGSGYSITLQVTQNSLNGDGSVVEKQLHIGNVHYDLYQMISSGDLVTVYVKHKTMYNYLLFALEKNDVLLYDGRDNVNDVESMYETGWIAFLFVGIFFVVLIVFSIKGLK